MEKVIGSRSSTMKQKKNVEPDVSPRSLRKLLTEIRTKQFGSGNTKQAMRRSLNDARRLSSISTFQETNTNMIRRIEEGEQKLTYEILETYARLLKIPTGFLLLVSRYQETDIEEAKQTMSHFLHVLNEVEDRNTKTREQALKDGDNPNAYQYGFRVEDLIWLGELIDLKIEPPIEVLNIKETKIVLPFETTALGLLAKKD